MKDKLRECSKHRVQGLFTETPMVNLKIDDRLGCGSEGELRVRGKVSRRASAHF